MSEAQRRAVELAQFYFRLIAERAEVTWDGDNNVEVELMVCQIIDAAAAGTRRELADVITRVEALEQSLDGRDAAVPSETEDTRRLDRIRVVLAKFDWETSDRQYALEEIERIADGSQP
jgi:hypothetical protein